MLSMPSKVVVITGASAGIGAALAQVLAPKGLSVALVARRVDRLQDVAKRCKGKTLVIAADVSKRGEVARVARETISHFGRIDVWVNNVGQGISRNPSE